MSRPRTPAPLAPLSALFALSLGAACLAAASQGCAPPAAPAASRLAGRAPGEQVAPRLAPPPASPPAAVASASPSSAGGRHVYRGTIAGKPVVVRLRCTRATCDGYYFYETIGESLRLVANGRDSFDEHVGVGKAARKTGHLAFEGPPGAASWRGSWSAPPPAAGRPPASPLPVALARVGALEKPLALTRSFSDRVAEASCHVRVRSFELLGLADPSLEDRLNALLSPESLAQEHAEPSDAPATDTCGDGGAQCDVSPKGYRLLCRDHFGRPGLHLEQDVRPALLDDKILSLRSEYWFDGGGAHPSDGVSGVTIDFRTGRSLDARDFLRDPDREPNWNAHISPAFYREHGVSAADVPLALGTRAQRASKPLETLEWADFYLTPSGFELVPMVAEVARVLRHKVQHVPFTKVRASLLPQGPAAHLYAP
jgi:hypothetical protein